ncbi:M28 family peptidase [Streptomyces sp. AC536]|uniref:M28 family peptidase n=1 Tax=Streptomyces buecherae TaxID=2763006 RepID=UPI00164E528C|nr:M28 family peptidase [Streptomyces buecherae]MBC3986509.1 M28 family peptidase [Streptomyces buecherae]QNJ38580.1 M28 family peptidase [Streptomyces buecherae]
MGEVDGVGESSLTSNWSAVEKYFEQAPTSREMMGWIEDIYNQGIRRAGYPADSWIEEWAAEQFRQTGLEDVRLEPLNTPIWRPKSAHFEIWPTGKPDEVTRFSGLALPYSTPTEGTEGRLARMEDGEVSGGIAVQEITFSQVPQSQMAERATDSYDPEGVLPELVQTVPFDLPHVLDFDVAAKNGATAYVGLLTGVPWETSDFYWPYDAERRPIPGIWLSGNDGRKVRELMASGECEGRIVSDATLTEETTHNVVGTLPGASDHWVIIGSHHDGPWASAVEDASGVSLVLAQARFWASVPRELRPHNMLFLLTSGHMAGAAGTQAFIADHQELFPKVVLEMHLEHVARRADVIDGEVVASDDPEVRWWFATQAPALEHLVLDSLAAEDIKRSWLLSPTALAPNPATDGAYFYYTGVPLVQYICTPIYIFDPRDTPDKVDEPSLVPLSKAAARIIAGTVGCDPDTLRVPLENAAAATPSEADAAAPES